MTAPSGDRAGTRVGRYRLLSLVGAGGMGEVYRAHDEKLSRDVAVKLLPAVFSADPERLRRFEQEASAAGSLNHPNVLTVHDVGVEEGTTYLVSELLEGETLRRRLEQGTPPVQRTIEIVSEICQGLAAAHDKGVVHRDLKPENVFLTRQGRVKILDFGVAKLRASPAESEDTGAMSAASTLEQTRGGVVLGTTAYMSPEQIRGESLDGRSDLFAVGSVLYECLSGRHPFRDATAPVTLHRILSEDPPPLGARVGPGLERVVRRCLEKRPEERFQSARDLGFALEAISDRFDLAPEREGTRRRRRAAAAIGAVAVLAALAVVLGPGIRGRLATRESSAAPSAPRSVAVLPFQPRGEIPGQEYLALAVPDEVATVLTYAPGLAVRSFTDSSRYGKPDLDFAQAGRELGVQHLVAGSIGREGDLLRLSVEAIELPARRILWRDTWTVPVHALTSLRESVRERVSSGLLPALGNPSGLLAGAQRGPASAEGYELYLRATGLTLDKVPNGEARRLLERATALDPDFAPAWLELARRLDADSVYYGGGEEDFAKASLASERAASLDADLLPAAVYKNNRAVNQGRVVEAFRAAVELVKRRPDSGQAHFALAYALRYGGATDAAAQECRVARSLDPNDPGFFGCYWTFIYLQDYEQAESFARLVAARHPDLHAGLLADIWMRKGDRAAARAVMAQASPELTGVEIQRACLQEPHPPGTADLVKRDLERSKTYFHDSEAHYWYAALMADCGYETEAFHYLEVSVKGGYCAFVALDHDTLWTAVRSRPRFLQLRDEARACRDRFAREALGSS
jgi:TolB-like protein/Tfp pilus assembly protein PilF